jgi:uncharacterized protein (UPF0332 family)
MGIADDLPTLADRLANPAPGDPEQACLRRAISTAYYALFHLLVQEAVQGWSGSPAARLGLERTLEHRNMRDVSGTIYQGSWKGWSTPRISVPAELKDVAKTFFDLQEWRHEADYDNAKTWTADDVRGKVARASAAFQNWQKIRTDPATNEYLLSLLVGKKRE